jgi:hypothetical protein
MGEIAMGEIAMGEITPTHCLHFANYMAENLGALFGVLSHLCLQRAAYKNNRITSHYLLPNSLTDSHNLRFLRI